MAAAVEDPVTPPAPEQSQDDGEAHDLTVDEVHAALSELGHNHSGELVFTKCVLSSHCLTSLPGLERYGNLQQLYLDHNSLTELTAVCHMPQLVYLSARHNRLTSDVFASLKGAAGCLERLHLDDNCLVSLSGLEALPYLTDLSCTENQIASVTSQCLSAAHHLMRLRLSRNCIASVDSDAFAAARQLRVLELQDNSLTEVGFLRSVSPQVERVVLARNRVVRLDESVQRLTGVAVLDLSDNELASLHELEVLASAVALRSLDFSGNAALSRLPLRMDSLRDEGEGLCTTAAGATEYHAEVVMSDAENDDDDDNGSKEAERQAAGMAASVNLKEQSQTVNPTYAAAVAEDGAVNGSLSADQLEQPTQLGKRGGGGLAQPSKAHSAAHTVVAAAAAPTTASYVALAAPEIQGFVRTVGSVARDAELSVRVDYKREVEALPPVEQVYLWTLATLPHLSCLNGQNVTPDDVARAHFLFRPPAE